MPFAIVRKVLDGGDRYHGLLIWCPGCEYIDEDNGRSYGGLHMLPVSGDKKKRPVWKWDGNLEKVTLSPSILTKFGRGDERFVCPSFLKNGVWQFLNDSTHRLAGKSVPMVPLPDWVTQE